MSFLLWFDNRTLLSCQLLLSVAFSIAFFGVRRGLPNLRGVGALGYSFLLSIPGLTLLLAQGSAIPSFFSVVIANLLLVFSFLLFYRGILHLLGSERSIAPVWIASLITVAIVFYYSQVHDQIVPRLIAISFNITLVRALVAIELFRNAAGRVMIRLFAISISIYALLSLTWGIVAIFHTVPLDLMQQNHIQTSTLLLTIFSSCLTGLFSLSICHEQILHMVRTESQIDSLSGVLNRRGIELKLAIELKRIERSSQHLSVALIDVDNFKAINDSAGHAAGDNALRRAVTAISAQLRAYDLLGRYGGDEFLLILPQTSCSHAHTVAERVGQAVRSFSSSSDTPSLTISIGLTGAVPGEQPLSLLARADQALYQAKHAGRNCTRTVLHQQESIAEAPSPTMTDLLLPSPEATPST